MARHEHRLPIDHFSLLLEDGRELQVTGCRQVLVYEDDCVLIRLKDRKVRVCGTGLTLHGYFGDEIVIGGLIRSVCLEAI